MCRWTQDSEGACNHQCLLKCFWYDKATPSLNWKVKKPRCFKNMSRDSLPILYANQSNAWVNATLFTNWFHQNFVPTVQEKLREIGCEPKAVLLLDNCSAHPDEEELFSADGKVIAKFLPPNFTSLIQPMDQGIFVAIKRRYWRKILEELVFSRQQWHISC